MSTTYTAYEIPLSPSPLTQSISLAGVQYQLTVKWNSIAQIWVLDIYDNNSTPIVRGIPLVCGIDLLAPFAYLNLGGRLYAQTDNEPDAPPTFTDLGITGHLYFVVVNN